jgi:hypothetical protein
MFFINTRTYCTVLYIQYYVLLWSTLEYTTYNLNTILTLLFTVPAGVY